MSDSPGELPRSPASEYVKEQDGMSSVFYVSKDNCSSVVFRFCLQVFAF